MKNMGLITVDAEKCTHCGNCLEECPFRLLEMKTESSLPAPKEIEVLPGNEIVCKEGWTKEDDEVRCSPEYGVFPLFP